MLFVTIRTHIQFVKNASPGKHIVFFLLSLLKEHTTAKKKNFFNVKL